jgi:hypothetical protein
LKKYLCLFAILLFSVPLFSQVRFGLKGGANRSNLVKYNSYEARFGFHAGLFSTIELRKNLFLQPEAVYSKKGNKQSMVIGEKTLITMDYFSIPVLLLYEHRKIRMGIGPELSFLLLEKYKDLALPKTFKKTDFSIVGELSYFLSKDVAIYLRYDLGLPDLYRKERREAGFPAAYSRTSQLGFIYQMKKD